jgi:hypothetical protein
VNDFIGQFRGAAEGPVRRVRLPVVVWSALLWLHGFVVGAALVAILARAAR